VNVSLKPLWCCIGVPLGAEFRSVFLAFSVPIARCR
jgi:hypothetical protein